MNYVILLEISILGIQLVFLLAFGLAYIYRGRLRQRVLEEVNLYVQSQVESVRQNPEALAKLLGPVIQKLLADMTKSMNTGISGPSTDLQNPLLNGNLIQDVGLSFLPKKYQAPASLILRLFGNRINPSSNSDNKDSKSPFQ